MSRHQPKELAELAFASFTEHMMDKVVQLLKWTEISPTSMDEISKTCRELKDFFHGMRLPSGFANEITKRLLYKLNMFSKVYKSMREEYFQQNFLPLVEVFMHPDVTSIELGPGYLYDYRVAFRNCIVAMIVMNVGSLHNLKTLSVGFEITVKLVDVTLVFPAQLKELTLCGDLCYHSDRLRSVVECCQELKSLKILGCSISHISVPDILKLNRLETLHLLGLETLHLLRLETLYLLEVDRGLDDVCVALINGISTDVTSDVLSASTLKSLGIELGDENTLHLIVDKLPHLTEIVLQLPREFDLSCLTQLKNLQSLTLDAGYMASDCYKKILPVLGKSLVFLELRGYISLDLEFIGETCSNLRCLHVCTDGIFDLKTFLKPSLITFPNFRTVECLKVMIDDTGMEFIIMQCVNIKALSVVSYSHPTVIENVLSRTRLTNLEEIHWYPEVRIENSCLEELCMKSPNLRLVHGLEPDSIISGFSSHECHKSVCEYYCYAHGDVSTF